jgi:hypothetical protein
MNALPPSLSLNASCEESLVWLQRRLPVAGLRVVQTFDLQAARLTLHDCPCPRHGTSECDCQMVVLLVYGSTADPATLILHGNDGQTWLSLVSTLTQHPDPLLRSTIEQALQGVLLE